MSSTSRVGLLFWPKRLARKAPVRKAPSHSLMPCSVGKRLVVSAQASLAVADTVPAAFSSLLSAAGGVAAVSTAGKKTLSSGVGRKKLCPVGPLIFTAAFTKLRQSMPRNSARLLQSSASHSLCSRPTPAFLLGVLDSAAAQGQKAEPLCNITWWKRSSSL